MKRKKTQHSTNPDARFWNTLARKYAADPISDMVGYERTLEAIAKHLDPADRVLELGCGTGTTALRLAEYANSYLATDFATEMITIARGKLARSACPNLTFSVAAAEADAGNDDVFDAVVALNLLHLVADLDAALRGIFAFTRPGGLFISKTPCIQELNLLIRWGIPVAQFFGKAPKNVISFDEKELLERIAHVGFIVEQVERHGTKGTDVRPFVVARRPGRSGDS